MTLGHLIFVFFPNKLSNIEIHFMDPIIKYMNPQNLRFFEICAMFTAQCPNHYIAITSNFAPSKFAHKLGSYKTSKRQKESKIFKNTCFEVLLTKIQNEIIFSQVSDRCYPAQQCYFCQIIGDLIFWCSSLNLKSVSYKFTLIRGVETNICLGI